MDKTCKNCKWWDDADEDVAPGRRVCKSPKIAAPITRLDDMGFAYEVPPEGDLVAIGGSVGGMLLPGPDYHCIHFEGKNDED